LINKTVLSPNRQKGAVKTMEKYSTRRINTTLGELIAAASEVAFEYSDNDKEAYKLARLALVEILRRASRSLDLDEESLSGITRKTYLH